MPPAAAAARSWRAGALCALRGGRGRFTETRMTLQAGQPGRQPGDLQAGKSPAARAGTRPGSGCRDNSGYPWPTLEHETQSEARVATRAKGRKLKCKLRGRLLLAARSAPCSTQLALKALHSLGSDWPRLQARLGGVAVAAAGQAVTGAQPGCLGSFFKSVCGQPAGSGQPPSGKLAGSTPEYNLSGRMWYMLGVLAAADPNPARHPSCHQDAPWRR